MAENILTQLSPLTEISARPSPAPEPVPSTRAENARRAAEEFESIYLSLMFSSMFTDLGGDNPFGGGPGEKIYRSHLFDELGRVFARSGGVGIADAVQREMLRLQEV
ncbi:MAG: rod-binding protein [Alphaproteobacteria bacterium]|nr:rod-binding protein [Alphaproteobacteria bacterium]